MKNKHRMILLILLTLFSCPTRAIAHGANIEYETTEAIKIHATYDSGEPMSKAQVSIYSPDDTESPWLTGTTDEHGKFIFIPDSNLLGNWEVKVRQAGHGDLITINSEKSAIVANQIQPTSSRNYTTMQKALMILSVGWGFVGTTLFFSKKPLKHQH